MYLVFSSPEIAYYGLVLLSLCLPAAAHASPAEGSWSGRKVCTIPANGDGSDDTPAILAAFRRCRSHGRIVFQNATYHIKSVMKTIDLVETDIHINGKLLWSDDLDYWLEHPQYTGFQNGSAAWFLGGENITVHEFGQGTLDGNGQKWYDLVKGQSMYPNRPHNLAIWHGTNIELRDLRFVQSQMWSIAVMHSKNVLMDGVYIRSESKSGNPARNTDGVDTVNSDHVTFRNMFIRNGDDAIALKGNSTNILVEDSTFDNLLGLAFGSLGQYVGTEERVENVVARNIFFNGTRHVSYVKTWTGNVVNYPPNGGGGGTGYLRNITLTDLTFIELTEPPFQITQCTTFSGGNPDCESSKFKISDMTIRNWSGDTSSSMVASMDCSKAAGGCTDITIEDVTVKKTADGAVVDDYRCRDVSNYQGFEC